MYFEYQSTFLYMEFDMSNATLKDDLDYVRDLAEGGARAPLLGGRFLAWWGAVVTLGYAGHYAIITGLAGLEPVTLAVFWPALIAIGLIGYFTLAAMMPQKPGAGSPGNRAERTVWMYAGSSIFAFFVGLIGSQLIFGTSVHPDASLPLVFAVYALAMGVTGKLAGERVLQVASMIALAAVALTAVFFGRTELYLMAAAAVFASVFLPGLVLLRREPQSIV